LPKSNTLSERSMLVLTSLAGGEKHGYALIKDVEAFSGVRLGPGTLYAALARLEQEGLIRALPAAERRRPYEISQAGTEVLLGRLEQLKAITKLGLSRLAAVSGMGGR
jgi:DNA-binding PadR family transcriptional regulator